MTIPEPVRYWNKETQSDTGLRYRMSECRCRRHRPRCRCPTMLHTVGWNKPVLDYYPFKKSSPFPSIEKAKIMQTCYKLSPLDSTPFHVQCVPVHARIFAYSVLGNSTLTE